MKKLLLFVFCLMASGSFYALPRDVADAINDDRHTVIVYVCSDPDQLSHEMKGYPIQFHKEDNYFKSALLASGISTAIGITSALVIVYVMNK